MMKNIKLWHILLFFTCIFSSISIVNHYYFRTYAFDLGMFNHALYSFSNFKANYFTLDLNEKGINYFGDHFSLITILYVPFYYLLGSYTLLIIQIASILLGGIGIYKYAKLYTIHETNARIIVISFLCSWGIYSALSFDFHNNVVASMLIPWLFYYYKQKNRIKTILLCVLILVSKENMAIWLIFIFIGFIVEKLWMDFKNNKFEILKYELWLIVFFSIYFYVVLTIVMPSFRESNYVQQFNRYSTFGTSFPEILKNILTNPIKVLSLFFGNSTGDSFYDGIKTEFILVTIFSGGVFLFLKPKYLIMIIPLLLQKFLSNDPVFWGINCHYSIEFTVVLPLCLIEYINTKSESRQKIITTIVLAFTLGTTLLTLHTRKSIWYNSINSRFYHPEHYRSDIHLNDLHRQLDRFPDKVYVSTLNNLAPHIARRDKIYLFPVVRDAEYILLLDHAENTYPLNKEEYQKLILEYKNGKDGFEMISNRSDLLIFKKK